MRLNLIEILENVPIGTKLYSPIGGECIFNGITKNGMIEVRYLDKSPNTCFYEDGNVHSHNGECLLFPSKENRDWSTFKIDESIKVGDRVKHEENR